MCVAHGTKEEFETKKCPLHAHTYMHTQWGILHFDHWSQLRGG